MSAVCQFFELEQPQSKIANCKICQKAVSRVALTSRLFKPVTYLSLSSQLIVREKNSRHWTVFQVSAEYSVSVSTPDQVSVSDQKVKNWYRNNTKKHVNYGGILLITHLSALLQQQVYGRCLSPLLFLRSLLTSLQI